MGKLFQTGPISGFKFSLKPLTHQKIAKLLGAFSLNWSEPSAV